ncbi:phage tail fiber protein [Mycolicibacter minnesotensis]
MAIPNATHQAAADAITALGDYISVHTAAAGTTGTNEATGGGYSRKQTDWGSATNATPAIATGTTVNIPVAAGTYKEAGVWSAASSGNFVGSAPFTGGDVVVSGSGASIDVTPTVSA